MTYAKYERRDVSEISDWIINDPNMRIIAITGPRQTGKTTIALQTYERLKKSGVPCKYYAMDNPHAIESESKDLINRSNNPTSTSRRKSLPRMPKEETLVTIWEHGRMTSQQSDQGLVIILDEIQVVPQWSNIVKGLWDADRRHNCPLRVVILGSAPWRMMTGMNESLMGRFDSFPITHWSLKEMSYVFDFSVDEYIFFGGYPGPWTGKPKNRSENLRQVVAQWRKYILNSIIEPAINRDVVGLKRIHKPPLMRQLVDLAPNYSGQIISYNKLLGHLQDAGNTTTLTKYIDLLSDAGLMTAFSRYANKPATGRRDSTPKLNVLNTALMTANSVYSFQEARTNQSFWGHLVESAVGAHLYNSCSFGTNVYYWRDRKNLHEVDYVMVRGERLLAIEVKSGAVRTRRGLRAFQERFPHASTLVVGAKEMPLNEFFSMKPENLFDA